MLRSAVAGTHAAALPLRFAPPPLTRRTSPASWWSATARAPGCRKSASALEALLRRLRLARYDWDKVYSADRLDVAWVLWEGTIPPAEHEAFLRASCSG